MVWMLDILSDYHVLRRYVFQGLNGTVSPESEDPHKPDNMPKDELTAVLVSPSHTTKKVMFFFFEAEGTNTLLRLSWKYGA